MENMNEIDGNVTNSVNTPGNITFTSEPLAPNSFNLKGLILKGLAGVFVGFLLSMVIVGPLGVFLNVSRPVMGIMFFGVWILTICLFAYWGAKSKSKEEVESLVVNNEGLTIGQRIMVWILVFLNPIIFGAIFYFTWRHTYPHKAKEANIASFVAFGIYIFIGLLRVL